MKRPVWALHVLVVGLALHNFAMAELWDAGVRGFWLDVASAWKEVVLFAALVLVVRARRGVPFEATAPDWLALGFGALVVLYGLIPQGWLGGGATAKGVLYGARHDLLPVAAYFLGRGLDLTRDDMRRLSFTIVATGCAVAAFGLVDVYAIPLQWWRESGAPGWFREQLGLHYRGLSGLPENFVYNTGNERPLRRLVSTFLSPLAASYVFVVALLLLWTWRRRSLWWLGAAALVSAGLLWTHSRSSYIALAVGLGAIALSRRAPVALAAAVGVVAVGALFVDVYPSIAPEARFTPRELKLQRSGAAKGEAVSGISDASTESHWRNLRDGAETVVRHPWGYGLGNAGVTAFRTNVKLQAGESTYTELGVETGLLGALVFIAWSVALVRRVLPRSAWVGASLVAVLVLALQTDVIGVPWLAVVLWALAGDQS
ncbi:MAG TPA: O-antigen ligase family protein [Gaiellaceae bacterium]